MEKQLSVNLNTPYYTLNEFTEATERVWLVFHGYGQLGRFFINKFKVLNAKKNFVIAPQGLSKFYLEGTSGKVGATWMTSDNRLVEIENQYRYIKAIVAEELGGKPEIPLYLFGFSQGVSTMMRFASRHRMEFEKMVLWAGKIPPELTKEDIRHWPPDASYEYYVGDNDHFVTNDDILLEQTNKLKELTEDRCSTFVFQGKHEIAADLLMKL